MSNISLIILTKNESENIKENLIWLDNCPVINEIIAVDDCSTDNSIELIKKLETKNRKVKIFERQLENNFSHQRNFAISQCSNKWILSIDCDEKPSDSLQGLINHHNFNSKVAYAFKREDIFLGKTLKHGETSNLFFTRLFNKSRGQFIGAVHEVWYTPQPITYLPNKIYHNSHKSLNRFLNKINFYTDLRAEDLYKKGVQTNLFQIIFYPFAKFIQNYIFKLGFLDSTAGIIIALSMSFHSFLVRAKLWHLYQK